MDKPRFVITACVGPDGSPALVPDTLPADGTLEALRDGLSELGYSAPFIHYTDDAVSAQAWEHLALAARLL